MRILASTAFETAVGVPALAVDEIHLWLVDVPPAVSPRALSAFAHAELGRLLAIYSGLDAPVAFARNDHGKPHALDADYPQFNLSHGGQRVALAFARKRAIGVDVEAFARRHRSLELAERFFAPGEAHALGALDPHEQQAAFVNLWTCKEAVLKALGRGIAFGLDRLRFDMHGMLPDKLVEIAEEAGAVADWHLLRFDAGSGHVGALAWHGSDLRVRAMRIQRV